MQIGQVIRKYRKEKDMTQEEMANCLGVTAPAVNKWENGNSMPDITLLAPIARLLDISLDTLLSFREELTAEEIQDIIYTVNSMLREKSFGEAFAWAKEKIEQYPDCEMMILEIAVLLNAEQIKTDGAACGEESGQYEKTVARWLDNALKSGQEQVRMMAADSMFSLCLSRKQYDKAEGYLQYLSEQNPKRKCRQALIYSRTDRRDEAYKAYEELLFSTYQMASLLFHSVGTLAMQDQNMDKVRAMVEKQSELAALFEMGRYHQVSGGLELAVMEQDADETIRIMETLLDSVGEINDFVKSPLYEHMSFQEVGEESIVLLKEELINACIRSSRDEEAYGFLKDDERWKRLIGL